MIKIINLSHYQIITKKIYRKVKLNPKKKNDFFAILSSFLFFYRQFVLMDIAIHS
jgi:hypothetical protein